MKNNYVQNFLLFFFSLKFELTVSIVKNSQIRARNYFIFLKNVLNQT